MSNIDMLYFQRVRCIGRGEIRRRRVQRYCNQLCNQCGKSPANCGKDRKAIQDQTSHYSGCEQRQRLLVHAAMAEIAFRIWHYWQIAKRWSRRASKVLGVLILSFQMLYVLLGSQVIISLLEPLKVILTIDAELWTIGMDKAEYIRRFRCSYRR